MNYDSSVRYLLSLGRELAAPTQAAAAKFDLENITVLAERLGRPDRAYPSAHIAGTNGKGSTAAFLESILRHAGFRTALNTSPHLEKINERIRISGEEISDQAFAETFSRIQVLIEELLAAGKLWAHPMYFECVTAMSFEHFARERVEFAVFEVGLGGGLDAAHIFFPVVPAAEQPEAREGILSRSKSLGCEVIEAAQVFRVHGQSTQDGRVHAHIIEAASGQIFEVSPSLPGRFQLQNSLNALAAVHLLQQRGFKIPDGAITRGIAETVWPGRLEKLQSTPDVYCDGAHNPGSARELAHFLGQNFSGRKIFLIYAALRDKAVDEVAGLLFPYAAEVIFTAPRTSRAVSATQLAEIISHHAAHFSVIPDAERALEHALAEAAPHDAIFITGSLYLVGQLRHHWKTRVQVHAR